MPRRATIIFASSRRSVFWTRLGFRLRLTSSCPPTAPSTLPLRARRLRDRPARRSWDAGCNVSPEARATAVPGVHTIATKDSRPRSCSSAESPGTPLLSSESGPCSTALPPSLQALSTCSTGAIQVLFGVLFSAYVIYYPRSASLTTASLFLLGLLVANELLWSWHRSGYLLFRLYFLAVFCSLTFLLPVALGAVGIVGAFRHLLRPGVDSARPPRPPAPRHIPRRGATRRRLRASL